MIRKLLIIAFGLKISLLTLYSQSEQLVVNLPATAFPYLITFENPKGSVKVTGYDGVVMIITGTLRFQTGEKTTLKGLHKIEQNSIGISAEVNGSNVTVLTGSTGKTIDFDIKVPRKTSLKIKSLDNGSIEIVNVSGEVEVENSNGDISLENAAGSAVLSSVYGKISANFMEVNPLSPMMFTSFEGDITLTFPAAINANLKLKSEKGEILTGFDLKPIARQPVVKKIGDKEIYTLGNWALGSLNSGGPEYIISSYTGNIEIRKK
jgi:hypothetical protein